MNDDDANDANDLPFTLNNEATVYSAIFVSANPVATSDAVATASRIAPGAHFLSSGLKLGTEIFWKGTLITWMIRTQ